MSSIPSVYVRGWAAAQVKSQISHPDQNKAVKHWNWIYSPPVSRTRLPEWSEETSTRPGSKVLTQAKLLKFASTSSSIRGSPHYETKDPSNWTRKIRAVRAGGCWMLKVLLYVTHLLVLEMVQSALMTSRHLHGHKFQFKTNRKTTEKIAFHVWIWYDGWSRFKGQCYTIVDQATGDSHASHRQGKS